MKLKVVREEFTKNSTIGSLYIDGTFFCYTLEDVVRAEKIYGETAIPYGEYRVILSYSNRFKKILPEVLNVPNYSGVRIHAGNTKKDTHGCPLVGLTKSKDFVGMSRVAFNKLMERLRGQDNITILIE